MMEETNGENVAELICSIWKLANKMENKTNFTSVIYMSRLIIWKKVK